MFHPQVNKPPIPLVERPFPQPPIPLVKSPLPQPLPSTHTQSPSSPPTAPSAAPTAVPVPTTAVVLVSLNDVDKLIQGLNPTVNTMMNTATSGLNTIMDVSDTLSTVQSNSQNLINTVQPLTNLSECDLPICKVLNMIDDFYKCEDPLCKNLTTAKNMLLTGDVPSSCDSTDFLCKAGNDVKSLTSLSCTDSPDNIFCKLLDTIQSAILNVIFGFVQSPYTIGVLVYVGLICLMVLGIFVILCYLIFFKPTASNIASVFF
jgi:hypothetical protein